MADASGFQLSPKHPPRSCLETVLLLNQELELYKEELLEKPALLVVNKLDLPGAQKVFEEVREQAKDLAAAAENLPEDLRPNKALRLLDVVGLTAANPGAATEQLKRTIRRILDEQSEEELVAIPQTT